MHTFFTFFISSFNENILHLQIHAKRDLKDNDKMQFAICDAINYSLVFSEKICFSFLSILILMCIAIWCDCIKKINWKCLCKVTVEYKKRIFFMFKYLFLLAVLRCDEFMNSYVSWLHLKLCERCILCYKLYVWNGSCYRMYLSKFSSWNWTTTTKRKFWFCNWLHSSGHYLSAIIT